MDKIPLVLWSGGLDSTYIVWDKLADGKSIDTVYIDLENNTDKVRREIKARNKLKEAFGEYEAQIRKDYIIKVPELVSGENYSSEFNSVQAFLWAQNLMMIFNSDRHSHVETGYIRGDDFWHMKESFIKYVKLGSTTFFGREEPIDLKFPLEWETKESLVEKFNDNDFGKRLLNDITWCECSGRVDGKWTKNCDCVPCTKMRKVLYAN